MSRWMSMVGEWVNEYMDGWIKGEWMDSVL